MIVWLEIGGTPLRQIYHDARALNYLTSSAKQLALLRSVDPLRSSVEGETANITALLDNRAGQASREFATPPLGAPCSLVGVRSGVAVTLFSGLVDGVVLDGDGCRIEVTA